MTRRIVIVDDDRDTREMLQVLLESDGYSTLVAQNGLRLISTLYVDRADLILLDVMMSWIDGFELCQAIKRNPQFAGIPVMFISGKVTEADRHKGLACGAVDYFKKPLDTEHLLRRIHEVAGPP
jgi:DNA-binding response OmpR family regulator